MSERGRRIALATVLAASVAIAVLAAVFLFFFYGLHCTSGDGGAPYVAGSSPQKSVCDATGNGIVLVIVFVVAIIGIAIAAWGSGKAWVGRRAPALPAVLLIVAMPLLPLITVALADLPSDDCSGEQEAAYGAWLDKGGRGKPPYKCETY